MNFNNFEIFAELVLFSVNLFSRSDMHIQRVFTGALQNRFILASGALNFIFCLVQREIVQISLAVSTAYERWDSSEIEIQKTRLFWGAYHREQLPTVLPYACASSRLIHIWVSLAIGPHSEVLWHQQSHISTGETICPKTLLQYCALAHGLEAEDCGTKVELLALPESSFLCVFVDVLKQIAVQDTGMALWMPSGKPGISWIPAGDEGWIFALFLVLQMLLGECAQTYPSLCSCNLNTCKSVFIQILFSEISFNFFLITVMRLEILTHLFLLSEVKRI